MSGHETKTTFDGDSINAGWLQFREHVAPEVRERVQKLVTGGAPGRASVNAAMSMIIGEMMAGNIPPAIEPMLYRWMELLLGSVAHAHIEQGTPELAAEGMRIAAVEVLPNARVMLMPGRPREPVEPIPALTSDEVERGG